MALQFCDGFDSYGVIGDTVGKWGSYRFSVAADISFLPTGGRFGGGAVRFSATTGMLVRKTNPAVDEMFVWAAIFPRSYPTTSTPFLWFEDVLGNGASLRITTGGALFGTLMGSSAAFTSNSANSIVLGEWNTIALHFKCADSGGRWRLILNGVEQFNLIGDTRSGTSGPNIDRVVIGTPRGGAGLEWDWDDFILHDASGSYLNGILTSDLKIETLRPTADQPGGGWTPSTGTDRFALVDDVSPNDADFLSATATGAREIFTMSNPVAEPQTTHALVMNVRGRRTDVGARVLKPFIRVNAAEDLNAGLALSNQFSTLQHPVYRNPDGGGPWAGSTINAAQLGIELGS